MALQHMILVLRELVGKALSNTVTTACKTVLKSKYHSYIKWTRVRLHQDPYLKTEKLKREPIPIPIIETTRKSGPFNKAEKLEPELETNFQPVHSKYIHNVLRHRLSHDPTIGVYKDNSDGSFKIGRSSFKYNDKHVFVVAKNYKATQGPWELLTKSKPDKNAVTFLRQTDIYANNLTV